MYPPLMQRQLLQKKWLKDFFRLLKKTNKIGESTSVAS